MCGLVGIITGFNNGFSYDETKAFRDMLFMDTMRGSDATGIMYSDKQGNAYVHKEASPAFRFMASKEWSESTTAITKEATWAFGHNRAATRGDKDNDKNAHPFIVDDNIVLMQNGTYKGSHHHHKATEVDTDACAHVIAENEDISTALKKINAAYAFIWYNMEKKTLYVIRNDERPLFIGYTTHGSIFFSSEKYIMMAAAARNDIKFHKEPYELKPGQLCSFDFSNPNKDDFNYVDIDIKYDPKSAPQQVFHHQATPASGGMVYTGSVPMVPPYRPQQQKSGVGVREHGRLSIMEAAMYLSNNSFPDRNPTVVVHVANMVADTRKKNGKFICEPFDYVKVREMDESDNQWYVFATIISTDELHGELCCWIIESPDEKATLGYSTCGLYEVSPEYLIQRGLACGTANSCIAVKDAILVASVSDNKVH